MTRPFNLSEIEAKSLLALVKGVLDNETDMNEYGWVATVHAGRAVSAHIRDKLENFIASGQTTARKQITEGYGCFGVYLSDGKWTGYYFDEDDNKIIVSTHISKSGAQTAAKKALLK